MNAAYELKEKSVMPPGGFVFKTPNGTKYMGTFIGTAVEDHRRSYGTSREDSMQAVLSQTYANIPHDRRDYFIGKNTEALIYQNPTFRYVDRKSLFDCAYAYNPGLITVDDDDWLVYRRQMVSGDSDVCRMNFRTGENFEIELPKLYDTEQFEDPRVFWHDESVFLCICSWRKQWTYRPLMRLFQLDENWEAKKEVPLTFGGNGGTVTQKNWQFFSHEGRLLFIYHYSPFQAVDGSRIHAGPQLHWSHGEIRGGTPPVRVDDRYYTFFHSRTDIGRTKYHMGCLSFSAEEPFRPLGMTLVPLMSGTNREPNLHWTPVTVFPCGAIFRGKKFTVSLGVNDWNCGLVDFELDQLQSLMKPLA